MIWHQEFPIINPLRHVKTVQSMLVCREASSTADCKDVRQDPWPTLMYTHTQRRVQSSRAARLGALAIADGCDSRRNNAQATDPKIYIIYVCPTIYYTVIFIVYCFNRSNAEATLARLWAKVFRRIS